MRIPATMRALVLADYHDLRLTQRPVPVAAPDEVLIRVSAVGICGSDIHGYTGENGRRHPGQVMGHEAAGFVAHDPAGALKPGVAVTFNPLVACGRCAGCAAEEEQWCSARTVIGVEPARDAAMADYLVVPRSNVHLLPHGVPAMLGALIEPLAVAYHAVRRSSLRPEDRVLIVGGGPIGQSLVLACRQAGATRIAVSERDPARRSLCQSLGATVLEVPAVNAAEPVSDPGFDVAFDAVGSSETLNYALSATALGATVALVGMASPTVGLQAYAVSTQERSIVGCFCYATRDFAAAVGATGEFEQELRAMVSSTIAPTDAPGALARLAAGEASSGKVLIQFAASADGAV